MMLTSVGLVNKGLEIIRSVKAMTIATANALVLAKLGGVVDQFRYEQKMKLVGFSSSLARLCGAFLNALLNAMEHS
jgi:glucose uptake protein GlcU